MKNKSIVLVLPLVFLVGCSTITINPEKTGKYVTAPQYQESKSFFFWGLAGEHRVDVNKVCGNKKVIQMQSQQTFANGLLAGLTLGIYAPHTVKVWCS